MNQPVAQETREGVVRRSLTFFPMQRSRLRRGLRFARVETRACATHCRAARPRYLQY